MPEQAQHPDRGWWYLPGWLTPGWLASTVASLAALAFILDLIGLLPALLIVVVAIAIDSGIWLVHHDPRKDPD